MALTKKKRYPNSAARRTVVGLGRSNLRGTRTPINVDTIDTPDTTHTRVNFDQRVSLDGVPQYVLNPGSVLPTAARLINANGTVELTHPVVIVTDVTVPFEDPAVRNMAGGYVNPGTFSPG